MIVKCEQCQTRFKIPDEKVTDKGVKVRCTKCGHTFRVSKEGAPASGAGTPATQTFPVVPPVAPIAGKPTLPPKNIQLGAEPDPFSAFGGPPPVPDPEATRPGVFVLGLEASRVPDIGAPPAPPQAAIATPAAGSAFDFSSLAPPVAPAVAPQPVGGAPAPRPVPRSSSPTARQPAAAPPPAGSGAAAPFDFSSLVPSAPAAAAPAPFDFSALGTPAASGGPPAAASTPSFDFSSLGPAPAAPAAPAPVHHVGPPPPAAATPAFDFSGLGTPPPPPPPSAPARPATATVPAAPAPGTAPWTGTTGQHPSLGAAPAPPTQPMTAWTGTTGSNPAVRPQSSAPVASGLDDGPSPSDAKTDALPALFGGQAAGADDFFGGALPEEKRPVLPNDLTGDAAKNALFDMAAALPPPPADEPAPQAPSVPERVAQSASTARPVAPIEGPRRRRTALGIVVNLVIAAVLVVALVVVGSAYLNEGKISAETLTWEHLKTTFAPSSDFVASDISNGLYDTKAGRAVFFVRGEVTNRGASAARLLVRAELLEGASLVRDAEAAAGAPASPEELYLLSSAEDLDTLNKKLAERAPAVEPGASAPFTVVFYEYPPDLKGFRVRVSARVTNAASTANRDP